MKSANRRKKTYLAGLIHTCVGIGERQTRQQLLRDTRAVGVRGTVGYIREELEVNMRLDVKIERYEL